MTIYLHPIRVQWEEVNLPPIGKIKVFATDKGICAIFLGQEKEKEIERFRKRCPTPLDFSRGIGPGLPIVDTLESYVMGELTSFSLPLELLWGTPFERDVWRALQTIPYGQCVSYQWVAIQIGRPRATRAVGNAVGNNPIPIIIPCHRVIRKDGSLGGFSSGLSIKRALLKIEGCDKEIAETPRART